VIVKGSVVVGSQVFGRGDQSDALPACFIQSVYHTAAGVGSEGSSGCGDATGTEWSQFGASFLRRAALLGMFTGTSAVGWRLVTGAGGSASCFRQHARAALSPTSRNISVLMTPAAHRRRIAFGRNTSVFQRQRALSADVPHVCLPSEVDLEAASLPRVMKSCPNLLRPESDLPRPIQRSMTDLALPIVRRELPMEETVSDLCSDKADDFDSSDGEVVATPPAKKQLPSLVAPPAEIKPSNLGIEEIFDKLDTDGKGAVDLSQVREAVGMLNESYDIGLTADDTERLLAFMGGCTPGGSARKGGVPREAFVAELEKLCSVLARLRKRITVAQLKVVVAAAFERFDLDCNGELSCEEFVTAAAMLGLELEIDDAVCLHRFFAPTQSQPIQQASIADDRPVWEKLGDALRGSLARMQERSGWNCAGRLCDRVREALERPGSLHEKVQRATAAAWEGADDFADAASLVVDTAGMGLAMQYVADSLGDNLDFSNLDVASLAPFLMFIGLSSVSLAKELDELVFKEMTEDEALLYARVFHPAGFSQAEFRRLLQVRGCHWKVAAPGEALTDPTDPSLKFIVRGGVEVRSCSADGASVGNDAVDGEPLGGPGTIINATLFLRSRQLWENEAVVATESVVYVAFDPVALHECLEHNQDMALRMDHVLAASIADALRVVNKFQRRRAKEHLEEGSIAAESEAARSGHVAADASRSTSSATSSIQDAPSLHDSAVGDGNSARNAVQRVRKADVDLLLSQIDAKLHLGTADDDQCARLFAFVDAEGTGEVDLATFMAKIGELEESIHGLGGMLLPELLVVLRRSFDSFDVNKDGLMSFDEFSAALQKLELTLSPKHARALFSYIDMDKDGAVNLDECSDSLKDGFAWLSAFQVALREQARRTGFTRFLYHANRVRDVLAAPGDPFEKAKAALRTTWDGADCLADVAEAATDATGVSAAVYGIWLEVCGINPWTEDWANINDELNLAPFLIFLGISGVHMVRHLVEGRTSDLTEREALLYTVAFENQGITVSEFQRLLSCASWVTLEPGENLAMGNDFAGVAKGACEVRDRTRETRARAGPGELVGEVALLRKSHGFAEWENDVVATERTMLAVWDADCLRVNLEREDRLRTKVFRALTVSMANRLINAHLGSAPRHNVVDVRTSAQRDRATEKNQWLHVPVFVA